MLIRSALRPFSLQCTSTSSNPTLTSRLFTTSSRLCTNLRSTRCGIHTSFPSSSSRLRAHTHLQSTHPLLLTAFFGIPLYALRPRSVTQNDTGSSTADFSTTPYSHGRDAKTPLSRDGGKTLNPGAVRQISLGGMLGLGLGLIFSAFSRSLVLLLGIGLVVWQWAARRGYNIIPVQRIQKYVRGVNVRSAINDNVAFKISFGLMFALSAFGHF